MSNANIAGLNIWILIYSKVFGPKMRMTRFSSFSISYTTQINILLLFFFCGVNAFKFVVLY